MRARISRSTRIIQDSVDISYANAYTRDMFQTLRSAREEYPEYEHRHIMIAVTSHEYRELQHLLKRRRRGITKGRYYALAILTALRRDLLHPNAD